MDSELQLIQECGFKSFDDVVNKINDFVNIMRVGRAKAETNLQRFNNQAKEYVNLGQRDKAKKEITKKKRKEEKIKAFDTKFNVILEKIKEVKNSTQMLQVLNATKYCNNVLLAELKENEKDEENVESKEYQDLLENDKEISKYLGIIAKAIKKPEKIKHNMPQNIPNNNINSEPTFNFDLDFNNEKNQSQNDTNAELNILKQCGFNSLQEAIKRILYFSDVMKIGKEKVLGNLEYYYNQAKEYLKLGQRDEAKKMLSIKKQKEEKKNTFENQLNIILARIREVKNSNQMLQVLNATKNCNNILLKEKKKNEVEEETKEHQNLFQINDEINKYIQIINSSNNDNNMVTQNYQGNDNQANNKYLNFPNDSI